MAGWLNRHQQAVIDYLIEENRVLNNSSKGGVFGSPTNSDGDLLRKPRSLAAACLMKSKRLSRRIPCLPSTESLGPRKKIVIQYCLSFYSASALRQVLHISICATCRALNLSKSPAQSLDNYYFPRPLSRRNGPIPGRDRVGRVSHKRSPNGCYALRGKTAVGATTESKAHSPISVTSLHRIRSRMY